LLITGIGVLVLGMLGAGGYFGYGAYRKGKTTQTAAAKAPTKTSATQTKTAPASKGTTKADAGTKSAPATKDKVASAKDKAALAKDKAVAGKALGDGAESTTTKLEPPTEPILKPRDEKLIRISAPRLSAELAANPVATKAKYKGGLLEVSGIYEK